MFIKLECDLIDTYVFDTKYTHTHINRHSNIYMYRDKQQYANK